MEVATGGMLVKYGIFNKGPFNIKKISFHLSNSFYNYWYFNCGLSKEHTTRINKKKKLQIILELLTIQLIICKD